MFASSPLQQQAVGWSCCCTRQWQLVYCCKHLTQTLCQLLQLHFTEVLPGLAKRLMMSQPAEDYVRDAAAVALASICLLSFCTCSSACVLGTLLLLSGDWQQDVDCPMTQQVGRLQPQQLLTTLLLLLQLQWQQRAQVCLHSSSSSRTQPLLP
jgi:hypothetical protein